MENTDPQHISPDTQKEQPGSPEVFTYPPKPELEEKKKQVWLKSLFSLALYLVFGFFIFQNWTLLLILTGIVIFHELGHFMAMKLFNYKELGIFFIPLLGAYASGTKHEVSQRQSIIILLAGPLPGIILGVILHFVNLSVQNPVMDASASLLLFLNLLNLLPVYPLDGGQILNRLFMDENHIISKVFVILSALLMIWIDWYFIYPTSRLVFFGLLYFPLNILLRLKSDIDNDRLIAKVESEGVDLNVDYADISDENYWKTRNALIKFHPDLHDIPPAPPYQYASREDKVITVMQGMLQRLIIMDLGVFEKIFIIILWIACFMSPYLLNISLNIFQVR